MDDFWNETVSVMNQSFIHKISHVTVKVIKEPLQEELLYYIGNHNAERCINTQLSPCHGGLTPSVKVRVFGIYAN